MATKIDTINEVLAKIGDNQITNLDSTDADAKDYKILFNGAVNDCLSIHHWNFALKIVKLTPLAEKPLEGYQFVYAMPTDRIGRITLPRGYNRYTGNYSYSGTNRGDDDIHIETDKIYSNYEDLVIEYLRRVDFEDCPGYFQKLVKVKFERHLQSRNAGQNSPILLNEYREAKAEAMNQNRQTAGGTNISDTRLVSAHLGGGALRGRGFLDG